MNITFIGAGNVATVLARLLKKAGHVIAGIFSASAATAGALASELGVGNFGARGDIDTSAEIYIIAVTDNAIIELAKTLRLPGKTVVHTSGSTPQGVLSTISEDYGVFYPLQSLRKQAVHQPVIPFLVSGSSYAIQRQVTALAESISPLVQPAGDNERLNLHLAAIMVSNFTNHLYALAEDYCNKQQVPFNTLAPLIEEVAARTALYSPATMQTGPAVRGDSSTIEKHLHLLQAYPLQQRVYAELTRSIQHFYGLT